MTSVGNHPRNGCYFHIWWGTIFYACSWEENVDGIRAMVGLCQVLLWELTVCKGEGKTRIQTESIERSEEQSVSGVVGERKKFSPEKQTVEKPRGFQAGKWFYPEATWWWNAPNAESLFLKEGQTFSLTIKQGLLVAAPSLQHFSV